jgi:hypothetical protein
MSGFLGAAMPTPAIMMKDERLNVMARGLRATKRVAERSCMLHMPCGYGNDFWPGNRGFLGDHATGIGVMDQTWARRHERVAHGIASRVGFVGRTYDANGNILAGVTCSLFRTSDKLWIMDVVSGADGSFLLQSWYSPDTHFIVFSKAGAPEVYGTTRQTLVGA